MILLYDHELSGNCYKVRLLLSLLRQPYERFPVDLHPMRENRSAWFLALNPLGQVPVLADAGFILRESHAILVYLASRPGVSEHWYPRSDARALAQTVQWLEFASGLSGTIAAARNHALMQSPGNADGNRAQACNLLRMLDEHLWFSERAGEDWLTGRTPSIADVACFPWVMLSGEAGIDRLPWPAIARWADRIKRLPGFTPMSGVFPTSPALVPQASL